MSDIIENGKWKARAVQGSAKIGPAGTGTEQIGVLLQLKEGPSAGQYITWYGYFTPAAEERTLDSLRYMGWQGDDFTDMSTIGDDDAEDVLVTIEHEEGNDGNVRARASFINRLAGVAMKTVYEGDQLAAFAAKMRGKALAHRQKSGAPKNNGNPRTQPQRPPAQPSSGGQRLGDDDIPF